MSVAVSNRSNSLQSGAILPPLNIITNDIYLENYSYPIPFEKNQYNLNEIEFIDEKHDKSKNNIKRISFDNYEYVDATLNLQPNDKYKEELRIKRKKGFRSFFKLIRPPISKRRTSKAFSKTKSESKNNENDFTLNEPNNNKDLNSKTLKKRKMNPFLGRSKLRPNRSNSFVENHYDQPNIDNKCELDNKNNTSYNTRISKRGVLCSSKRKSMESINNSKTIVLGASHNKTNRSKTTRALSMITRSNLFSSTNSPSSPSSVSSPTNFNSSNISCSMLSTTNSSCSKELTWYKLEELDNYYKVLGNFRFKKHKLKC